MYFKDYKNNNGSWITTIDSDYYPDYLTDASDLYSGYIEQFGELLNKSTTSADLLRNINLYRYSTKDRIQILRVFRKYVSPTISVEMLKKKRKQETIIQDFGSTFRPINEVKKAFLSRENPDFALMAILYEYKDRGQKGYDLTRIFFKWFRTAFPTLKIIGPETTGTDLQLKDYLDQFGNHNAPTDFIILDEANTVLAAGYARYDSDRGGSQEDDRVGGNRDKISQIKNYNMKMNRNVKVIFLNDGPGLVLGSMWDDYSELEEYGKGIAMVLTLKMLDTRLTSKWLQNGK